MLNLNEQGALKHHFDTSQTVTGLNAAPNPLTAENATSINFQIKEGLLRGIQVQMDNGTVQELGGALRGTDSVTATKVHEEQRKSKEKKDREARRLQKLLDQLEALDLKIEGLREEIAELDAKIDKLETIMQGLGDGSVSIEDALEEPDARDAIQAWEKRTGKTFDPNDPEAADILFAILATHVDGLKDRKSGLEQDLEEAENERDDIRQKMNDPSLSYEELMVEAKELVEDGGYNAADYVAKDAGHEDIISGASEAQAESRSDDLDADERALVSSGALDDLFAEDNALDFASDGFGKDFSGAAKPTTEMDNELANKADPKMTNGLG